MWQRIAILWLSLFVGAATPASAQEKPVRLAAFGPRTDIHGDPLPEGAIARLGTNRLRPLDHYSGLSFSPDGRILASTGDKGISLWDTETGKLLRRAEAGDNPEGVSESLPSTCRFLPDGRTLIGPGFRSVPIRFWDAGTGKEIQRFPNPPCENPQTPAKFEVSFDGKLAATSTAQTVTIWEIATGKRLARLVREFEHVHSMTWAPTTKALALIWEHERNGFSIHLWDVDSGEQRRLAFSRDTATQSFHTTTGM